jgi:hypothetical protein
MIEVFNNEQELNDTLAKWQKMFELDRYEINVEYVPFEELNRPGMNQGLFTSTYKGGWNTPLTIALANSHEKYKNKTHHKRCDELELAYQMYLIKRRITDSPDHYLGALRV